MQPQATTRMMYTVTRINRYTGPYVPPTEPLVSTLSLTLANGILARLQEATDMDNDARWYVMDRERISIAAR